MANVAYTAALRSEYEKLFSTCSIRPEKQGTVDSACDCIVAHKPQYLEVSAATGVPWYVVSIVHYRECGLDFSKHLHNGDPLIKRTTHVPAKRPKTGNPPFTFLTSAIDALSFDGFSGQQDWSLARTLYLMEKYNGLGYRLHHPNVLSPYLWCFTNHYTKGGYKGDGDWSDSYVNKQCGTATLLRRLAERREIEFATDGNPTNADAANAWSRFAGVRYDPNHYVALVEQLQHALNQIPGIHLREDGKAGKNTSDALKAVTGHYLTGDPRGA